MTQPNPLVEALERIKRELTIPAAEYVPAIPDVWAIIDEALASHRTASTVTPQGAGETAAWLVEWPASDAMPPRWWNPRIGWCLDANKAMWLGRKSDAEAIISSSCFVGGIVATEHMFVDLCAQPSPPAEGCVNLNKQQLEKLKRKGYRQAYVAEHVKTGVAYQVREMRDERGWSQKHLAETMDKPQSVVSRIEDPEYGKLSVQTLLEVASAFDVALLVQFVSFEEFIARTKDVSPAALNAESFREGEPKPIDKAAVLEAIAKARAAAQAGN